jgi:hypothetical protein
MYQFSYCLSFSAVGLGAPVLTWHGHAGGVNDMRLDAARSEPPGQPEAIPAASKATAMRVILLQRAAMHSDD